MLSEGIPYVFMIIRYHNVSGTARIGSNLDDNVFNLGNFWELAYGTHKLGGVTGIFGGPLDA